MNSQNIEGVEQNISKEQIEELRARANLAEEIAKMGPAKNNFLDEPSKLHRKLEVFGTDLSEVPCFRNTLLYGILGGFGAGIGYFALTSKVKQANAVCMYSMFGIIAVYWIQCRWRYSNEKFRVQQLQYILQQKAMYDGTSKAPPTTEPRLKFANLDSHKDDEFMRKHS